MGWDYAELEYGLSVAILSTAMCGMGASLTTGDLIGVVRSPRGVIVTLLLQVLATPLLALGLASAIQAPAGIRLGMLLVAALPGGLFSNVLTFLGRGNLALSITATTTGALTCLASTVAVMRWLGQSATPGDFSMPVGRILFEITVCMLVPLAIGMAIRRQWPVASARVSKILVYLSCGLLALIIMSAMTGGRAQFLTRGWLIPSVLALYTVSLVWLTYLVGWVVGMPLADSYTVGIGVVIRNAHLGLLLKASLFPAAHPELGKLGDDVLYILLLYGAFSLAVATTETLTRRLGIGLIYGPQARLGRLLGHSPQRIP